MNDIEREKKAEALLAIERSHLACVVCLAIYATEGSNENEISFPFLFPIFIDLIFSRNGLYNIKIISVRGTGMGLFPLPFSLLSLINPSPTIILISACFS